MGESVQTAEKPPVRGRLFDKYAVADEPAGPKIGMWSLYGALRWFYFAIGQELPEQAPVEQGDGAGAAGAGLPLP